MELKEKMCILEPKNWREILVADVKLKGEAQNTLFTVLESQYQWGEKCLFHIPVQSFRTPNNLKYDLNNSS